MGDSIPYLHVLNQYVLIDTSEMVKRMPLGMYD